MPVTKVLTEGIGEVDMREIDVYRQRGGYRHLFPSAFIRQLKYANGVPVPPPPLPLAWAA